MIKTNKITLNIKSDGEGGFGIIISDLTGVLSETLLPVEDAFTFTARIRIGAKTTIPPVSAKIIEKMMDNAVAEGCSDDFSSNWVVNNKGNAAAWLVTFADNAVA